MAATRFLQIGCMALLLTSCSQRASDTGVDAFGHMGETSGGSAAAHFAIRSPFLQQGDRMTVVLLAEHPGKSLEPASLFLLKLTAKNAFSTDGRTGNDSDKTDWHQKFAAAGDKKYPVRYEIPHKPLAEQLTLGERAYSLEEGRVFLIDLTAQPVHVTQVKEALPALLPNQPLTREDLKGVVDKLREKHESVRTFSQSGR